MSFNTDEGYCRCGCGQKTDIITHTRKRLGWVRGEHKKWIHGHQHKRQGLPYTIEDRGHQSPCWTWRSTGAAGYGTIRVSGKSKNAHRHYYEMLVGPAPNGLELDHLCRNRACVNPSHLEPVTRRQNILRGAICRKELRV